MKGTSQSIKLRIKNGIRGVRTQRTHNDFFYPSNRQIDREITYRKSGKIEKKANGYWNGKVTRPR